MIRVLLGSTRRRLLPPRAPRLRPQRSTRAPYRARHAGTPDPAAATRAGATLKGCGADARTRPERATSASARARTAARSRSCDGSDPGTLNAINAARRQQLRAGRGRRGDAVELADGGPADPGRGRAILRPDDQGRRQRLRPLRRHPQPGLRRHRIETARTNRRSAAPATRSSATAGRWRQTFYFSTSGGHTETTSSPRRPRRSLPARRPRPLRRRLALPPWTPRTRAPRCNLRLAQPTCAAACGGSGSSSAATRHGSCRAELVGSRGRSSIRGPTPCSSRSDCLDDRWTSFQQIAPQ